MRRPLFIAEQARHPRGIIGRVVAAIMKRETEAPNRRVIEALQAARNDRIIDIGCGNGVSLAILAEAATNGHIFGIDPSPLMVERAMIHNRALIDTGRVTVALAEAGELPFPDNSFDKVMSVHTIYFWKDLSAGFREIARVLKPGGRCALYFRTSANDSVTDFSDKVYRFRSHADVVATLEAEGFSIVQGGHDTEEPAMLVAIKC